MRHFILVIMFFASIAGKASAQDTFYYINDDNVTTELSNRIGTLVIAEGFNHDTKLVPEHGFKILTIAGNWNSMNDEHPAPPPPLIIVVPKAYIQKHKAILDRRLIGREVLVTGRVVYYQGNVALLLKNIKFLPLPKLTDLETN